MYERSLREVRDSCYDGSWWTEVCERQRKIRYETMGKDTSADAGFVS